MPELRKKFLQKYLLTAEQIRQQQRFEILGSLLQDPGLWHFNRRSVAGAVAIGLFCCYIPFPLQMVQAALLAVFFRVNLPISISTVWITNPFTIPPMFYLAYLVGAITLGVDIEPFAFQFSLDWIFLELGARWRPFLLGCLIMASLCATLGFITVRLLWRLHLLKRIKARKLLRSLTDLRTKSHVSD